MHSCISLIPQQVVQARLGAGLGIAVSCDILLCSENACLGLPEVDVGLMGGGRHAMRVCGHSLTRRMMCFKLKSEGLDKPTACSISCTDSSV